MTRAGLLLFALIAAFAVGAFAAMRARRAWEHGALPVRRVRPPAVEAALAAWEAGREPAFPTPDGLDPESLADLAFLRAVAGGEQALREVARRYPDTDAAARALYRLVERASTPAGRAARRQLFAERWPDAWVLAHRPGAR